MAQILPDFPSSLPHNRSQLPTRLRPNSEWACPSFQLKISRTKNVMPLRAASLHMAFSFTLPELRAELRALGHDGLPDHLILTFLSQLRLPLPSKQLSASSSDSSPYDTDASTCSTHSLSCTYGSRKDCSYNGAGALEGKTLFALEPSSCAKPSSLPETIRAAEFGDGSSHRTPACRAGESNGNTKRLSSSGPRVKNGKLPRSRVPVEHEERLNSPKEVNGAENSLNEENVAKSVEFADDVGERGHESPGYVGERGERGHESQGYAGERAHVSSGYVGDAKPNTVLGFGRTACRTTSKSHHAKGTQRGKHGSTDNLIEHYWISVGEEHMRAMHSKISKEKQHPSAFEFHGDADTSIDACIESKNGRESLIAKVQRCEDELQNLTLSLQAQQFKKPWFLEVARKPRAYQKEKHDFGSKSVSLSVSEHVSALVLASDPAPSNVKGCEKHALQSQSSMAIWNNNEMVLDTCDKASGNPSSSLVEHVGVCLEAASKSLTTSEERSQQPLRSKADEGKTMEAKLAVNPSVGELEEVTQIEDTENKVRTDLCPDESNDPDHSVCSKSSSASYQHSRSSGDSRSNGSQQLSTRLSSRKPQQHKKRGGKIDRVARFAEMQRLWKRDTFLAANDAGGKRKGVQSFHHLFSSMHSSSTY